MVFTIDSSLLLVSDSEPLENLPIAHEGGVTLLLISEPLEN